MQIHHYLYVKKATILILSIIPILSFSQAGTDIFLLDMQVKGEKITLTNPVNITHRKGYDNQPMFAKDKPLLYFTADRDSAANTDIEIYDYKKNTASFFTTTPENEYSATLTPDGQFISCIIQRKSGAQDLGKYPVKGGPAIVLIDQLKVGYHAWIDNNRLLLFVLDDSAHNSLHYYNLLTKEDKVIAKNPGRSLYKIPGQNAMSFIEKSDAKTGMIKRLDIATMQITDLGTILPAQEYMAWTSNGLMITSDGTDLFSSDPANKSGWQKISFEHHDPAIRGITRLAINADQTKMAIVVKE